LAGFLPDFQDQINPHDKLGGVSCTCYSAAMAGQFHTRGAQKPTGKEVRALCRNANGTPDVVGGTTLGQIDDALRRGWQIDLDTRVGTARVTWAELSRRIGAGQGAVLQGGYDVIKPTRFAGSETFAGNHALFVAPGWVVMDPLADGRRPAIYGYHGEAFPEDLMRRFAGALVMNQAGRRLGNGFAYVSFTRDVVTSWRAGIHPTAPARARFWVYTIAGGEIMSRRTDSTGGFSARCTPPRLYRWPGGPVVHKSLVELISGARARRLIETRWATELQAGHAASFGPIEDEDPSTDDTLPPPDEDEADDADDIANDDVVDPDSLA
jgi:hypothetical protein